MPLPIPKANESEDKFMTRCMGDPVMVAEYDDEAQRYAVCASRYSDVIKHGVTLRLEPSDASLVQMVSLHENSEQVIEQRMPVLCALDEKRLVYAVAMEPDEKDAHNEFTTKEQIEKAAHGYMRSRIIGVQHEEQAAAELVESWLVPEKMALYGQQVTAGTWVVGIKIHDDELWKSIKGGEFGGVSIGGWARRVTQ